MAKRVPRRCTKCLQLVTGPCSCTSAGDARPTAAKRGYGAKWQRFRDWFLNRHPRCEDHWEQGVDYRLELEVHHKVKVKQAPHRQYEEANCMTLCKACHAARTAKGE